jgi:DNA (cytosine-5)-methyltransferase 1
MKEINQLDLFSGIGGFHLGFERAGFKVNSYFSEVDKHAVAVYKHQFKDSTYVGSVTDVRGADLPRIDLITFGSPCQDFSLAGKRKGMGGERSSLITEAIRLVHECRPRVFIWENVKGTFSSNDGADFWAIIQAFANIRGYRCEWQLLNTSWFLPQNRERIYLVGYLGEARGDSGGVFPLGEARGEDNEPSEKEIGKDITHTICSSYAKFTNDSPVVFDTYNYKWREDGNVGTLTSHSGNLHEGFKIKEVGDFRNDEGWRPRKDGLSPCLATRRSSEQDISTMPPILKGSYRIRRLTPIECERLQGFPDNHTSKGIYDGEVKEMSNTQRYKQCGNAVTVDVVQAIANKLHPMFEK